MHVLRPPERGLRLLEEPTASRYWAAACCIALIAAAAPGRASAQSPPSKELVLNEDQAVTRALSRRGVAELWEAEIAAERARGLREGAWPNPRASVTREQSFEDEQSVADDFLLVEQRLPLSGRRGLRSAAARERTEATRLETRADGRQLAARVRRAFYELLRLQDRAEVHAEWLDTMREAEQNLEGRVEAGESARYELERLRKEIADIRAQARSDAAALGRNRAALSGLLGLSATEGRPRVEGVLLPEKLPSEQELVTAIARRPELLAARSRVDAARLRRQAASRWWVPEPVVTGGYKRTSAGGERFGGFVVGLGVSIPLFNQEQGEQMAANAALVRAQSRRLLLEQRLTAVALGLVEEARELRAVAQSYQVDGVERARRILEMARAGYDSGEIGILELLDAYRGVADSRLRLLDAAFEARARQIELQEGLESLPRAALPSEE